MHLDFTTSSDCPTCAELRATIVELQQRILTLQQPQRKRKSQKRTPMEQRAANGRWVFCACGCGHLTIAYDDRPAPLLFNHHKRPPTQLPYIVSADGCWLWQRGLSGSGYGQITRGNTTYPAHRAYYEQKYGPLPKGAVLDHLCCVRGCVNPEHVEPVTVGINTQRGKVAKLTVAQVVEIRALGDAGTINADDLARRFGVCATNIRSILLRKTWRNIPAAIQATGD